MITLLIDGNPAALPSSFSFPLTVENPYFTNSGEYSGEVQLSAIAPENVKIFGQFSRFEKSRRKQVRSFELIDNGNTIMTGKAVTIAFSSTQITIQLLGGNSEINYMSRYDNMYIDNMRNEMGKILSDWAYVSQYTGGDGKADYARSVMKDPSERDWVMLPALSDTGEQINCRALDFQKWGTLDNPFAGINELDFGYPKDPTEEIPGEGEKSDYAIQPRFCALVRKVIEAMGFTIRTFDAEQTHLKYLYYVNIQKTLYWSEMMPHWTCSQFIDEVQKLFGCVFVFDTVNKICDIKSRHRFFNEETLHLSVVDDVFEAEEDEEEADINNSVLQYNTDDYPPKHIFESAAIERIAYVESNNHEVAELMLKSGASNLVVSVDGHWYARHVLYDADGNPTGEATIEEVNDIGCTLSDDIDIKRSTELNIVPAKMSYVEMPIWTWGESLDIGGSLAINTHWKIPAPVGAYPSKTTIFNVDAYVSSGEANVAENNLQQMRVAFFTSWDEMPNIMMYVHSKAKGEAKTVRYNATTRLFCGWAYSKDDISKPSEEEAELFSELGFDNEKCGWVDYTSHMTWDPNCALRNKSGERTIYSGGIQQAQVINTTLPHTFRVYDDVSFSDVFKTFIIRGHKYACKQLEYKVSVNGIEKVKQGTFYQID